MGPVSPKIYAQMRNRREAEANALPLSADHRALYRQARRGASSRDIVFDLSERDLGILVARSNGRCEMTGIAFNNDRDPQLRFRPWRMSIDRLENAGIYQLDNCRLVCAVANLMRGASTLDLAHVLFLEYARSVGAIIPDELVASRDADRWRY